MNSTRRGVMLGGMGLLGCGLGAGTGQAAAQAGGEIPGLRAKLAEIERRAGGRLGVGVFDANTGRTAGHRLDERFPMYSTFKLLAAAAILQRVDRGSEKLDRRIRFTREEVVTYSPETTKHVGGDGMTLAAICEAGLTLSDNTAGNLMLGAIGGPPAITAFARSVGDRESRLDRTEPTLNEVPPGEVRDTTTPGAFLQALRAVLLGDALSAASREQLHAWLRANKTGDTRIKAGLPAGWRIGDKTGSGEAENGNDVAILWPPEGKPVILCGYVYGANGGRDAVNAALAAVGAVVAESVVG
ncbi:class A beta-lactamase [Roseomonas elaeocarpi]|uniref:Beta-lactamase n=1 Tax=Roseomonas elaeocarpi TaxID=907779 RepID=A0ABV6JWG6_9PROT